MAGLGVNYNQFFKKLPAKDNNFEVKRAGTIVHVKINKSCPILGLITDGPALRNALIKIMAARDGNFKSIMGAEIKKTDPKADQHYVSTISLVYGDQPQIGTDAKPIYNTYANVLIKDLKIDQAHQIFKYWQEAVAAMFPKFTAQPINTAYGLMNIKDFLSDTSPKCKLSITLMGYNDKFSILLSVADVKEKPIDTSYLDDLLN